MDLVEIREGYLAENKDNIYFGDWFKQDWVHNMYPYYYHNETNIPIANTSFTVGDNHVELYDGFFVQDPYTELNPDIGGHLMTLSAVAKIVVKDVKVEGKMCIRHPVNSPIYTKYELNLKKADMIQHLGFVSFGDELLVNLCIFEFPTFDISLQYRYNSETKSMIDQEKDVSKRHLLERFLVEYITSDLCHLIHRFAREVVGTGIDRFVSTLCGKSGDVRNQLINHNKISHKAFKNLAIHVLTLTNDLIKRQSTKLHLPRIYGLTEDKNLKVYTCFINNLNILGYEQREQTGQTPFEVIISNQDDCLIIHVPVRFWDIVVHYSEIKEELEDSEVEFKDKLSYRTGEAHFILSLKKSDQNRVEFKLLKFKIVNYRLLTSNPPVKMTMDHLVTSAIENYIESVIEKTFEDKKLQELAIKQNIVLVDDAESLSESSIQEDEE